MEKFWPRLYRECSSTEINIYLSTKPSTRGGDLRPCETNGCRLLSRRFYYYFHLFLRGSQTSLCNRNFMNNGLIVGLLHFLFLHS